MAKKNAAVAITITCPQCGGTGPYRYLEDIVNHREVSRVMQVGRAKILMVDGFYETGEGYDDGTNPRLECRNDVVTPSGHTGECLHEFPIPDDFEVDFC